MQAFNPYLPSYEYVPDGEPRVFGDRVYIFGSHDRFNGNDFCENDYVCWSAPVENPADWKFEGTIYRKEQDPRNEKGKMVMCAPDVVQGPDGRYYLYYEFAQLTVISVAVCDSPAGQYEFLGYVQKPDGTPYGEKKGEVNNFDPGVLVDDDGKVYLYTGFSPLPGFLKTMMGMRGLRLDGAYCIELEADMHTMKKDPVFVVPGYEKAAGTDFEGHAFFEASSMRKVNGKYYFIYSSQLSHELCYAVSDSPTDGFRYGGTLISIGDIGYQNRTKADNYTGNTHGSMIDINGEWYVFYHRQTNKQKCARQGCAEKLEILPNGSIPQVEMTSCGLNNGPLEGTGTYEARTACMLTSREGTFPYLKVREKDKKKIHPYFTQSGTDREKDGDQYIANMTDGARAGFKYFALDHPAQITVSCRGNGNGRMKVYAAPHSETERSKKRQIADIPVASSNGWSDYTAELEKISGICALYFVYEGQGAVDFKEFTLK